MPAKPPLPPKPPGLRPMQAKLAPPAALPRHVPVPPPAAKMSPPGSRVTPMPMTAPKAPLPMQRKMTAGVQPRMPRVPMPSKLVQTKVEFPGKSVIGPSASSGRGKKLLDWFSNEFTHSSSSDEYKFAKSLIKGDLTYQFADKVEFGTYADDPENNDAPTIKFGQQLAVFVNENAMDIGEEFKGPHIPFSGSRVYGVAYTEGMNTFNITQNSATGYVAKAKQEIVKEWRPFEQIPPSFPSNTKKEVAKLGTTRPDLMANNAHAEVNAFIQHAIFAFQESHAYPHAHKLAIGSDIAHCAECWWAANAMQTDKGGLVLSITGCQNKLFERWREPWVGFYMEYGDNPFRKKNGTLKTGLVVGTNSAHALNALVKNKIYK